MGSGVRVVEELIRAKSVDEILGYVKPYPKEVEIRGRIERGLIEELSKAKKEPDWMRRFRLRALEAFEKLPTPRWLYGIEEIDLEEIAYYVKPKAGLAEAWEDLPDWVREAYQKLGLPEAEARALAGLTAVFDSEAVLKRSKQDLSDKGVIVMPMDEAVRKYPDIVKEYFGRVYPCHEHKFSALHCALWSGGAFTYVPPGVRVEQPIEAFFFIGSELEGQFEHTLVVAGENSYIHFIEGCAAPIMRRYSFHDGMVELYAHRGARLYFSTIQNWSRNIVNFNNKRGIAEERAHIEWLEGSIGSKITFTYPTTILRGRGSTTKNVSVSLAHGPVAKDVGAKAIHIGEDTKSYIISKGISGDGGLTTYRGLVKIVRGAKRSYSHVQCDSLILDDKSKAYTFPRNEVDEPTAEVGHEASVGRLGENQLFYLGTRGLSEGEAKALVVLGFIQDALKGLPIEVVSVLSKVIELEFSELGAVG